MPSNPHSLYIPASAPLGHMLEVLDQTYSSSTGTSACFPPTPGVEPGAPEPCHYTNEPQKQLYQLREAKLSIKEDCLLEFKYTPAWSISQQPQREDR